VHSVRARLVRLPVQDAALSRRRTGFDSPTSYLIQNVRPGVVTEACRSDTAATTALRGGALVRLRAPSRRAMVRATDCRYGRMVRLSPFKRNDVGSIPTGGTCVTARRLTERPPSYKGCTKVRLLPSRSVRNEQRGIKVLAAAHSVLTRAGDGSSPSDPTIETSTGRPAARIPHPGHRRDERWSGDVGSSPGTATNSRGPVLSKPVL
jgi:hypothetical protein